MKMKAAAPHPKIRDSFWQRTGFLLAIISSLFLHGLVLAALYVQPGPQSRAPKVRMVVIDLVSFNKGASSHKKSHDEIKSAPSAKADAQSRTSKPPSKEPANGPVEPAPKVKTAKREQARDKSSPEAVTTPAARAKPASDQPVTVSLLDRLASKPQDDLARKALEQSARPSALPEKVAAVKAPVEPLEKIATKDRKSEAKPLVRQEKPQIDKSYTEKKRTEEKRTAERAVAKIVAKAKAKAKALAKVSLLKKKRAIERAIRKKTALRKARELAQKAEADRVAKALKKVKSAQRAKVKRRAEAKKRAKAIKQARLAKQARANRLKKRQQVRQSARDKKAAKAARAGRGLKKKGRAKRGRTQGASYSGAGLSNPRPPYPQGARERRQQGRVLLSVRVGRNGRALSVRVSRSSGHSLLDHAARNTVRRWRFRAAVKNGRAVSARVIVPISFRLRN